MSDFNGAMLRLGRQFRGVQQKELAERASVDAAIVSRAENKTAVPSETVIGKLADVLNVRRSLFSSSFQPSGLPISYHPMWCKRQSVSQGNTDRVLADANLRGLHIRKLLPSVVFEPELVIPRIEPGEYRSDCREIARLVRRAWGMPSGPALNLTEYLERAGIFIFHVDLEKNVDVDGLTLRPAGLSPVIVLNFHIPADRMRFTLAHELVHLVMPSLSANFFSIYLILLSKFHHEKIRPTMLLATIYRASTPKFTEYFGEAGARQPLRSGSRLTMIRGTRVSATSR